MPPRNETRAPVSGIRLALLNSILNLFWSLLCLIPVYCFCWYHATGAALFAFGGISLVPYLLPSSVIDHMVVSSSPAIYRQLGVTLVNRFTQDGALVRKLAGRQHARHALLANSEMIASLQRAAIQRERFHLAGFVFFLLLTGRAVWLGKSGWILWLVISNIIYNAYPVLLQQHLRLRLRRVARLSVHT